ncbi:MULTISPECIES: hypothetical protein [unclassified Saccharothrix]|uniref:hypothetical protein n=1 Tax=unclassified Saccharothrix TaxID=2593673 RepID=UPI00307D7D6C
MDNTVTDPVDNHATQTYLALRFAMLLLAALLLISIGVQVVADSFCVLQSISAYYHTAVRGVFVGALCAIGACLIVYRGNLDRENVLLDYSGFMAFLVAFVPTEFDRTCTADGTPTPDNPGLSDAVANNVLSVLLVAVIAAVAAWRVRMLRPDPGAPLTAFAKRTLLVTLCLLVIGGVVFFTEPDLVLRYGHAVAAVLLFAGIIAVVWYNAADFAAKRGVGLWWNRYTVMAVAMAATVVACVALYLVGVPYAVLIVEALLIAEFGVFWGMQTAELGNREVRPVTREPGAKEAVEATSP